MTLEMLANLGAVGVIGIIAFVLVKAGIDQQKSLVEENKEQREMFIQANKEIADSFKNTIDNHLDKHTESEGELARAIKELTREIKNGRKK